MPERSPDDVPVPREVSAVQGHAPAPTNVLNVPAQHVPTPGLAFAVMRVPGAPTLPEADPASMNVLLARMATEMFRAPPVVDQHATPGSLSPPGERETNPFKSVPSFDSLLILLELQQRLLRFTSMRIMNIFSGLSLTFNALKFFLML